MKQLILLCLLLGLYSHAHAQDNEQKQYPLGNYIITSYNENMVKLKDQILEKFKIPKKIRNVEAEGIINYRLYFNQNGDLRMAEPLSKIGYDLEEEILDAINNINRNEKINLLEILDNTDQTHVDVDFPFYVYNEEVIKDRGIWGGGIGGSITSESFMMSIDTYANGDQYKNHNFENIFPDDGYISFLTDLSIMFTHKIKTSDLSSKEMVDPVKISFTVDETSQFKNLKLIDNEVYAAKECLESMKEYTEAFRLNPTLYNGKPTPVEYILVINVYDKSANFVDWIKKR